ncbi:hypothetical protein FQN57_007185 [Myotisia sp. PD_48]|nr:hypothetical protein FQN57_007185 [Myotisia sp. PD_48]
MPVFSRLISVIFRIGEIGFAAVVAGLIVDLIISLAWFASFGLQVNSLKKLSCGGVFEWNGFIRGGSCGRWKAAEAFSFLSAIFWLVSTAVGIWFTFRTRNRRPVAGDAVHTHAHAHPRRRWYRRHVV